MSAAADRDDDFELVAVRDRVCGKLAARNDLAVAFDSDALARKAEAVDQLRERERLVELTAFAVQSHGNHCGWRLLQLGLPFATLSRVCVTALEGDFDRY